MASIVILALAWATGLYGSSTRNVRFAALALVASAAWFVAGFADPSLSTVRLVIAIALGLAVLFPHIALIATVTNAERSADSVLERALSSSGTFDPASRAEVVAAIRRLVPSDGDRLAAARLRLWARARQTEAARVVSTVPADYFDQAGRRFLHDAQTKRLLGRRSTRTAWDEDIALRAFNEEAQTLLPSGLLADKAPVAVGAWVGAVEQLVQDVEAVQLHDPVAARAKTRLIDAIKSHLVVALGDRSDGAIRNQAETAIAMQSAWQDLGDQIERVRPARVS